MEFVRSIETVLAGWFKDFPHLPPAGTKWLTENAWWLVLIGVAIGVFGIFGALGYIGLGGVVITAVSGPALGSILVVTSLAYVAFSAVAVVLEAIAISPLKALQKKGWDLVFIATLVSAAGGVITGVIAVNTAGILTSLLGFVIASYFLFEVRGRFVGGRG